MITINVKAIITLAIFFACVWWGRDVWLTLAVWLKDKRAIIPRGKE